MPLYGQKCLPLVISANMRSESIIVSCRLKQEQTLHGHRTEVLKRKSIHRPLNDVTGVYPIKEKSIDIFVGSYVLDYLSK